MTALDVGVARRAPRSSSSIRWRVIFGPNNSCLAIAVRCTTIKPNESSGSFANGSRSGLARRSEARSGRARPDGVELRANVGQASSICRDATVRKRWVQKGQLEAAKNDRFESVTKTVMNDRKEKLKAWARSNPQAAAAVVRVALGLGQMTDEQRIEQLIAHGHDARLLSDRRIVVRLGNGRWYHVVGGDFRSPSLLACSEQPPEPGLKP